MYSVAIRHDRGNSIAVIAGPFKKLERAMRFVGGSKTVIIDSAESKIIYKWRNGKWVERSSNAI